MKMETNQELAKAELLRWKSYLPFRAWFSAEIQGEWKCFDSRRKMMNAIRKAGQTETLTMAAQ